MKSTRPALTGCGAGSRPLTGRSAERLGALRSVLRSSGLIEYDEPQWAIDQLAQDILRELGLGEDRPNCKQR
jgi:hypothetical protein